MIGIDHFYVGRRHGFGCEKAGKVGRNSLIDDHSAIIWEKGDHDKGLQLYLYHIWPRGKPRKLTRASPSIKLARAQTRGSLRRTTAQVHAVQREVEAMLSSQSAAAKQVLQDLSIVNLPSVDRLGLVVC